MEEFLTAIGGDIFNPANKRKVKDNLTKEERQSLQKLRNWNRKRENARIIRVEDKGSSFVVDFKIHYLQENLKMLDFEEGNNYDYSQCQIKDTTFRCELEDPSRAHAQRVQAWAQKWEREGVISEDLYNWIVENEARPAIIYSNVKTHKEGWPFRQIMSASGTATESLARWIETQLKPLATKHESYIRDTRSFLVYLEELNEKYAPFPADTKLVSWDIKNFYPSCDTERCIEAVKRAIDI